MSAIKTRCDKCGGVSARYMTHKYKKKNGGGDISYHVVPSCVHGKGEQNE